MTDQRHAATQCWMAWAVFTFSSDGRARLAGVLRALLIAQLVVSLCMVIFCYNTSLRVMLLLKHIHKVTVLLLYGLILFQAYGMKLHYTGGLRLISLLLKCPHWSRAALVSSVWMITGSLVAVNGMLVYAACRGTLKALMKELSSSLRVGISQYLTDPKWKVLMDTMQVELSCCGADFPTDWHEIPWINMDFLNESSELVMKLAGADGKVLPPVSPYSCCTPRVLAPCYHDPLQQSEWHEVWSESSPLLSASLHTRGCVEAVKAPLTRALLALQCFNMLVFLFQVLIVVLTQFLRSSARSAVLQGACGGSGRGVLLGALPHLACPRDTDDTEALPPDMHNTIAPRDEQPPSSSEVGSYEHLCGRVSTQCGASSAALRRARRRRRRRPHTAYSYWS